MKYMVLIASGPEAWNHLDSEGQRGLYQQVATWWGEHSASGEILEGHQLQSAETATTVRISPRGDTTVTDGPFVEGKEIVGGYAIIDVPDLDAAIALVSGWPAPDTLEIRPVVENPG